jgi:hypothetical protein
VIEFCDVLVERCVRARVEGEQLGVADTARQAVRETRRELIVAPERDLRRRGNAPEMTLFTTG